jgi:hypothetical protein
VDSSYAKFISEILKASPQLTQLYHIARVLESEEVHNEGLETLLNDSQKISKKKKSTESIPIEVEHDIQVMRSFEQFPKILKKQFLLPESLFDQKLLKRDLLIQTPVYKENRMSWDRVFKEASCETEEKRLKRQRTYLLLDRSSSTAKYERLSLIKAIALLHLQTHQKGQGEVYFRSFHHNPGPLAISKNEGELQDLVHEHLLPLEPEGQTQLQKVIMKALDDIQYTSLNENWEFLIMTDGLSVIEPGLILEKSKQVKFHFVLVGQDQETYSDKELREIFHQQNKAAYARIDATASERERLQMENNMESAFQKEKKQLPQKLKQEHIQNLKYLCEESDGRWITCSDLNEMQRSTAFKKDSLIDQLNALYKVLEDPNLSPLEREHYLEQILLLQDQLRQLKAQAGDSTEDLEAIDQELKQFLESHPELQDLILEQGLKARHFNPGGVGEETSIWLLLLNRFKQAVLNQFK